MWQRLALIVCFSFCAFTAQAQEDADPVALINAIYKTYRGDNDEPGLPHVYSRRLQRLVDADSKATPDGEVGKIDWDVFIDGNDWDLSDLQIAPVSRADSRAQVRATFKNHNTPCENLFDLVLENGHWRIDEIQSLTKPRWIMSKILRGDPAAFPDDTKAGKKKK